MHPRNDRRHDLWAAIAIAALALAVRVAFALAFARTPLGRYLFLDARVYDQLAAALLRGEGPALEPFFVEPLYAYFLAAVHALAGPGLATVRGLQAVGGAATAALVFDLARRLYGRRTGWAAGLGAALYGPLVFYDAMVLKTSFEVLLAALFCWLLVRGREAPERSRSWLALGLLLGLAATLKANFLVLLPVALVAPAVARGPGTEGASRRAAVRGALWVAGGVLAVVVPVVARNSLLAGELTFLTTGPGMNFYQGNNPGTDGGLSIPSFIQLDPSREQEDSLAEARRRSGRPEMTAAEASRFWFAEALAFIREDPSAWLRLQGRKALLYWNHYEATDNLSFDYTRALVPRLWLAPVGYWLVAPLGLAALILGAGGGRREVLLRGTAALLAAGTIVFHVADRYRLATVPALLVLAAGYARAIVLAWRRGDRPRALGRAGLAVAAALLVNVPDFYPGGQDTAPFDHVMAYGAAAQGDPAAAARWAERAAAQYYRRGRAALEAGELLRARVYFERTLDARSDFPGAWYHLGVARERLGREAEAGRAYERAVATGSFAVEALTRLGRLHLAAGRTAEAETVLSTARERAPDSVAILVSLGDLWAAQGRFDEALALFEEARRIAGSEDWLDRRIAAARAGLTTEALPWR